MTKKAGTVRIELTGQEAREVVTWLVDLRRPDPPPLFETERDRSAELSIRRFASFELARLVRWPRRHAQITRATAAFLAFQADARPFTLPANIREVAVKCKAALQPAGRPRRSPAQTVARIKALERDLSSVDSASVDLRELRRLRRQARADEWFDRVLQRGETFLTFTEPPP